jgi:hypothetical protein
VVKWHVGDDTGTVVAGGNSFGPNANQFNAPKGIQVDKAGNIYVADAYNNRIQKWAVGADSGITIAGSTTYNGSLSDQLFYPYDLCFNKKGDLYICDNSNHRVQKWPLQLDTAYYPTSPGSYSAKVISKPLTCSINTNPVTVNTGYTYHFNGSGNWSNNNNWVNHLAPPDPLPACSKILVYPQAGSTCILDVPQTISAGANLTIETGSNFIINGNLTIAH